MMQPVVTALRATYGMDAVVDFVCMARCRQAAELLSGIDVLHTVERGTGEVLNTLREREFDYLLDLHGTVRSRSLARSLDVLTFSVDKQAWNRWRLIRGWRSAPYRPSSTVAWRCFAPLESPRLGPNRGGLKLGAHCDPARPRTTYRLQTL